MERKPIIGILQGDATGVGPEIVARLAADSFFINHCRPVLIGDSRVFEMGLRIIGRSAPYQIITSVSQADWSKGLPILDQKDMDPETLTIGQVNLACGAACVRMIKLSIALAAAGELDGICFAPFNKSAMKLAGNPVASELELMAELLDIKNGFGEVNMVDDVWTTRVTSHIPLKQVSAALSVSGILNSIRLANNTLKDAGIPAPRIGVSALNPHGGENGLCGTEEIDLIAPAVILAQKENIDAHGSYSADVLFVKAFRKEFDAVVTMYHDQGQIALKLWGFDKGITIGGGFPFPVTTCAHGTAHDIAGKGLAKTTSFENAVAMAGQMVMHAAPEYTVALV